MKSARLKPIHPGKVLEEDILWPLNISANALAKRLDVPVTRISEIIRGRRGITADTALRLARLFGSSAELWLGMQMEFELRSARLDVGDEIERTIVPMKRGFAGKDETTHSTSPIRKRVGGSKRPADRRRVRRK